MLATLPYFLGLGLWQAATLGPLAVAANRVTQRRDGWLFVAAAPVTMVCVMHGHNGFLTALLLGGGLLLLDKRPFAAGLLLGCLVYKPQFALLLPLLLLVAFRLGFPAFNTYYVPSYFDDEKGNWNVKSKQIYYAGEIVTDDVKSPAYV